MLGQAIGATGGGGIMSLSANTAVELNELLSEIDQYITGAIEASAMVPSVLGSIDASNDELNALHQRNDVLAALSTNLGEARRELQSMRVRLNELVEESEAAE
jgi:hypothetical protein